MSIHGVNFMARRHETEFLHLLQFLLKCRHSRFPARRRQNLASDYHYDGCKLHN